VVAAAPAASPGTLLSQAREAEQAGRTDQAVRAYKQAARAGSGAAAKRLFELYNNGAGGVGKDAGEANTWRNLAVQLGENMPDAVRLR
jgi:serine/threonine-protein kinase